jgi:mannose-1-phosphate guanylyltransferase
MQALILAGGEGTRLRPLTSTVPKPVVPLANRPFISYMIEWLISHGVTDVVMSCGFLADGVREVLGEGDGSVSISYITEPEPLGTAGAVRLARDMLEERLFVLNGDVLTDYDLSALAHFHLERKASATIALIPVDDPSAYGLVRTDDDGSIKQFLEKPKPEEIDTNLINAGAYVLEREVVDGIATGRPVSFEREVFPSLVGAGLYGFAVSGYWLDIGTPERYLQATRDILEGNVKTSVTPTINNGSRPPGATIEPDALLSSPALLGAGCEVGSGAQVGPIAVLGDGCRVGPGAAVERAVLYPSVRIEPGAVVRDSIIAAGARIGAGSRVEDGTIVGADAVVEANEILRGERVEPGARAARSDTSAE